VIVLFEGQPNGVFVGPYVGVMQRPTDPLDAIKLILLHELAHCLQFQEGRLGTFANPWQEFDADAQALEWAPRFGVRNLAADIEMLIEMYRNRPPHQGWNRPHGSPAGRLLFNQWQLRRLHPGYSTQAP